MPYLRHHNSQKAGSASVLQSFTVPSTQDTIAMGGNQLWDIVPPQETASQTQPGQFMTWQVPASMEMTDLNESFLQIEGYFDWSSQGANAPSTSPIKRCSDALEIPFPVKAFVKVDANGLYPPMEPGGAKPDILAPPPAIADAVSGGYGDWYLMFIDITENASTDTTNLGNPTKGGINYNLNPGDFNYITYTGTAIDSLPNKGQLIKVTRNLAGVRVGPDITERSGLGQYDNTPPKAVSNNAVNEVLLVSDTLPYNKVNGVLQVKKDQGGTNEYPGNTFQFSEVDISTDPNNVNNKPIFYQAFWVCGFRDGTLFDTQGCCTTTQDSVENGGGDPHKVMDQLACRVSIYNNEGFTVPFNLPAFMFNDVTLELNGTQVITSLGQDQPYAMLANVLKNEPYHIRKAGEQDRAYYIGDCGKGLAGLREGDEGRRDMFLKTQNQYADLNSTDLGQQQTFSMTYRISDCGFNTWGSWVPPATEIRLRTKLADLTNMTYIAGYKKGIMDSLQRPYWRFQKAELLVARKVLTPHARDAFSDTWGQTPCKLWFEQVRVFRQSFAASNQTINIINALAGPSPKCVFAFAIPESDILGSTLGSNPTNLRLGAPSVPSGTTPTTYNPTSVYWEDVRLSIGGARTYPIQSWSGFQQNERDIIYSPWKGKARDRNISQLYQMYQSTCNEAPFLTSADFACMVQPLCFQLEEKHHGSSWSPGEDTSIQFSARLSGSQSERFTVMLVSFTDSIVEITKDLDTTVM